MSTRKDKKRRYIGVVVAAFSISVVLLLAPALAARGGRGGSGGGAKGGGQRGGGKGSQVGRPARSGGQRSDAKSSQVVRPARSGSVRQAPSSQRGSHKGKRPQFVVSKGRLPNKRTINQPSFSGTSTREAAQAGRRRSVTRTVPGAFDTFKDARRTFDVRVRQRPRYRPIERGGSGGNRAGRGVGSKRDGGLKFERRSGKGSGGESRSGTVARSGTRGSILRKGSVLRRGSILQRGSLLRSGMGRISAFGDHNRFSRRHWRRYRQIIWPRKRHLVYYNYGPYFAFRYVYPRHHRKYLFVSVGGYWPLHYNYRRYYWYGYHPYSWYGYYPAAYEVAGNTYNYYTYNYGGETRDPETGALTSVDGDTFADVREKLAQESAKEPAAETETDRLFDEGVKAFEAGDYDKAADKFAKAGRLDPDDMILPFAYAQALFADEEYTKAAKALRQAVSRLPADQQDVFFPRGLYPDDDTLSAQIDALADKARSYSFGGDLELLLGYHLLATGRLEESQEVLGQIGPDSKNAAAAEILFGLAQRVKTPAPEAEEDSDTY